MKLSVIMPRLAHLKGYNACLLNRFDAYLGRLVLEVGSGVGNQTRAFHWILPLLRFEERSAPSFRMSLLALARRR
jgi:hypothetical protein